MARPENRSEARPLSLTLPEETFNYLALLATLGKLGRTENEVATHILVREAHAMHQRGFHERKSLPPTRPRLGRRLGLAPDLNEPWPRTPCRSRVRNAGSAAGTHGAA